jgi:3-deoxy-manno-octulosonate cytidylyltransferase (CMP-KDO synthetase)
MGKIIGVIPVRMGSSRFPGKPLFQIAGMSMLEHVWHRAKMYHDWDELFLATCDDEIKEFADLKKIPCVMTSDKHERALDRVAEAVEKSDFIIESNDIVLNVQGDEPMMRPDMITAIVQPMLNDVEVNGVVLSMPITDEEQFNDPNTLKIIHNIKGDILYTSRAPIPYCKEWSPNIGAKRIYGIFGFRWFFLQKFTQIPESPLEVVESCDSNRLYDNGLTQRVAFYPKIDSFAVDTPEDAVKVERYIKKDPYWIKYNNMTIGLP